MAPLVAKLPWRSGGLSTVTRGAALLVAGATPWVATSQLVAAEKSAPRNAVDVVSTSGIRSAETLGKSYSGNQIPLGTVTAGPSGSAAQWPPQRSHSSSAAATARKLAPTAEDAAAVAYHDHDAGSSAWTWTFGAGLSFLLGAFTFAFVPKVHFVSYSRVGAKAGKDCVLMDSMAAPTDIDDDEQLCSMSEDEPELYELTGLMNMCTGALALECDKAFDNEYGATLDCEYALMAKTFLTDTKSVESFDSP